jgi:DNA-binding transcriptional MerR regulator
MNHPATRPLEDEAALLPIREVARQTGVNPVTLRAWERRYGLITPDRTSKGHRLYPADQVKRIRQVLGWLERGVAVSQVKRLLEDPLPPDSSLAGHWREQQEQWLSSIGELAEGALEERFNQATALYPAETVCRQLLLPLLARLQQLWSQQSGARLEQVFFLSWLRTKLGVRLHQGSRLHGGAPLLLLNLSEQAMDPQLWLSAWLTSNAERPVRVLDGPIPAPELAVAASRMQARAVVLFASQSLDLAYLRRLLDNLDCPYLLCGDAVRIHQPALAELPALNLAEDCLQALHCLQNLGVLAPE